MQALVIDDSRAVRLIVANILRDQGYEVYDAAHGQEGLEKLRQNPEISLVLVDWNMPIMDGLEFIQTVRRDRAWDPLRIVMVTTETESEQVQRAMAAGANEYVMKPFDGNGVRAKLADIGVTI